MKTVKLTGGSVGTKPPKQYKTYFVSDGNGYIKIGKAVDVQKRFKSLQTGSSSTLEILAVVDSDKEAEFHSRFREYRVRGEWHKSVPALLKLIKTINGRDILNNSVLSEVEDVPNKAWDKFTDRISEIVAKRRAKHLSALGIIRKP